jgi:ribosomal protein L37AE/L43A
MNTFLYVLYRVTGTKKRECPACGSVVKKGITVCPKCGFDFIKAAGN